MNKIKEFAIFPGQIKINNEVFFGLDYKLTDFYNELAEDNKEKDKEIERLKNNWNKLEEWLNIQQNISSPEQIIENIFDKLQELKEK